MVAFPDIKSGVAALNPIPEKIAFKTLLSDFDNDSESAKQKQLFPRRTFNLKYNKKSKADARTLWQFFVARAGQYGIFSFFLPFTDTYVGEYVGTCDGSKVAFNLPSKEASSYTVYVNGAEKTETTEYTITSEGGADGADLLTMVSAPAAGMRITFDFVGYLKVRARFGEDVMSFETFWNRLVSTGITIRGLLNA